MARILLKVVLFLVLFVLLVFILMFTPPVQRYLTVRVQNYLENKLETKVRLGRVAFGLSGNVSLLDIYVEDRQQDTLISGGRLRAHLNYWRLFSNEVIVKDVELQNITAKITRMLPDTVFNFQFIVDAFAREKQKIPDTAERAPLKLNISDVSLENVLLTYNDIVTGSEMFARIGNMSATIDTLNPRETIYAIPSIIARNVNARFIQNKPLVDPEPLSSDIEEALTPSPTRLRFSNIDLTRINVVFENHVSAFYTSLNIGRMKALGRLTDFQGNRIHLDELELDNTKTAIRLGRKPEAIQVEKEVRQEVEAQKQAGWDFRAGQITIRGNTFTYDNDNRPEQKYGIDYAHMHGEQINLSVSDFVLNGDSVMGSVKNASFREKSGFTLQEFRGDVLHAYNQTYFRNLYIRTPGSLVRRHAELGYASREALRQEMERTVMDIAIVNSHVQVKDILSFAPHLRSHPALSRPEDIWYLDMVANGTLNHLNIRNLEFDGLQNTVISAQGTLSGLINPATAGGRLTINRLHTNQTDISLFTGSRLSTPAVNIPEEFDITGSISGNPGRMQADLDISTSAGFIAVNGSFSNLNTPRSLHYNTSLRASNLNLGSILRDPRQFGTITGNFTFNGSGLTAESINTAFTAGISSFGYNSYSYRNITLKGNIRQSAFTLEADARDPNADFTISASGSFAATSAFRVSGFVDSIKTRPLNLTSQMMIFRGRVNADIVSLNAEHLEGEVLLTEALVVTEDDRLPLDSVHLVSGRNESGQFIRLHSDIARAEMQGQYRFADLSKIITNSIQPYFEVSTDRARVATAPYDFTFSADVIYRPVLSAFFPGLQSMESLHAEGRFSNTSGVEATVKTPFILYNDTELRNLDLEVHTTSAGLQITGTADRIRKGNTLDLYRTRVNATAMNNIIDFTAGTDDAGGKTKYYLSGVVHQPSTGSYAISLRGDSLLLNYERWSVSPGNVITISPQSVTASNFTLERGGQRITVNSMAGPGNRPLRLDFTNFEIATVSGIIMADTLLINGRMNGNITFTDLKAQPLFTSDLVIDDFSVRQDTMGTLALQVSAAAPDRYIINRATLTGRGNDVSATGTMFPRGSDMGLDLNINIRQLQLNTLEGPLASAITRASGHVYGDIRVTGTLNNPDMIGDLSFSDASFNLTVLGTRFTIDDETLMVTEDALVFRSFSIRDSANNALTLNGTVATNNFINYRFNLYATADNFMILNSPRRPNSIYWGRLNISTELFIGGTERRPLVDGAITVNDGTDITVVIPQRERSYEAREGIVEFVDMDAAVEDSLFRRYDSLNYASVFGLDITTNIEIRKEASFNIIVDEANGDFLNMRGEALLSAGVDPSGKITLVGNYRLEEGSYEISFNFLRRRFEIERGSTITWTGSPTAANLNVSAVYIANTAPIDLVQDQIAASTPAIRNTYRQKLPFEVHLSLTGELMRPVVEFDIILPEDRNYGVSNDVVIQVQSRLAQIRLDEGEVNKQVFSLLLLNRFVGEDPFESSGGLFSAGTYARQSVSRLLTEQLNSIAGSLIHGIDIDFDVVSYEDYSVGERRNRTDLNVGLSKRLLNERLQITVGSNFELQGQQVTAGRNSNIAGNVAVNYQLSKDGRYMLRFYRRNEYVGVLDGYIIENGLGFSLNVDYDRFQEILRRRKQVVTQQGTGTN